MSHNYFQYLKTLISKTACFQQPGTHIAHAVDNQENAFHGHSTGRTQEAMRMVRATIRMPIPLEQQRDALEILGPIKEQTQFEPGFISCRVYRGVEDPRAIMLEELWSSDADLQRHLRSDKYRKILLVVEMAAESPDIRFDTIVQSSGVEAIELARTQID
jgi:quinol monooxygenase YgiN